MNEIFKDIKGYEGLYQISNLGRVKTLERKVEKYNALTKRMNTILVKETILKPSINIYGYYSVSLNKKNKRSTFAVHRLVADAFLENPLKLKTVNHIDKNKLNNNVKNLEFMSIEDNVKYSLNKPVAKLDINGLLLETYPSINEAGRINKVCYQNIQKVCKKIRKTAGGYVWRYIDEGN